MAKWKEAAQQLVDNLEKLEARNWAKGIYRHITVEVTHENLRDYMGLKRLRQVTINRFLTFMEEVGKCEVFDEDGSIVLIRDEADKLTHVNDLFTLEALVADDQ